MVPINGVVHECSDCSDPVQHHIFREHDSVCIESLEGVIEDLKALIKRTADRMSSNGYSIEAENMLESQRRILKSRELNYEG